MPARHPSPPVRAGPSLAEQGQCRTYESLVDLFVRHGAEPCSAQARARRIIAARELRAARGGRPFRAWAGGKRKKKA